MKNQTFQQVVVGGTFDHLHAGHQYLLDQAFAAGANVAIGLTSDEFIRDKKFASSLEPYRTRLQFLKKYLQSKNYLDRARIFPIKNIYGGADTDPALQAILVTGETYSNAVKINLARRKNRLASLKIIRIHLKKSGDRQTISSTRVRAGDIDREGHVYRGIYKNSAKIMLPDNLRDKMRVPPGLVFTGDESNLAQTAQSVVQTLQKIRPVYVVAVGDIIAGSLRQSGYVPDLTIIDLKSRRHKLTFQNDDGKCDRKIVIRRNSAGTISRSAADAVKELIRLNFLNKNKQVLQIEGEEDLLSLAAILHAPLGAVVIYGQRQLGVVMVEVNEQVKEYVAGLLKKFQI